MKIPDKCDCIDCPDCGGTGDWWQSGDHMAPHRFDDMGDFVTCPTCDGDGLQYYCMKCWQQYQEYEEEQMQLERDEIGRRRY